MLKIFKRQEQSEENERDAWRDGVYLCTVNHTMDAELLESKLRSEGIPSERKYVGAAHYLEVVFGNDLVGAIEIYVPEECLEDAKNIIVPVDLDDCAGFEEDSGGLEEDAGEGTDDLENEDAEE